MWCIWIAHIFSKRKFHSVEASGLDFWEYLRYWFAFICTTFLYFWIWDINTWRLQNHWAMVQILDLHPRFPILSFLAHDEPLSAMNLSRSRGAFQHCGLYHGGGIPGASFLQQLATMPFSRFGFFGGNLLIGMKPWYVCWIVIGCKKCNSSDLDETCCFSFYKNHRKTSSDSR